MATPAALAVLAIAWVAQSTPAKVPLENRFRAAGLGPGALLRFIQPEASGDAGSSSGFWIALPSADIPDAYPGANVIKELADKGSWALQETAVMAAILNVHGGDGCRMIDIGAHLGYFGLMSASCGCFVTAVEPNLLHRDLIRLAAHANSWGPRFDVVGQVVSNGTAVGFDGFRVVQSEAKGSLNTEELSTMSLTEIIGRGGDGDDSVLFMKIDVEGHEAAVLESASRRDLARIGHLYVEVTTHLLGAASGSSDDRAPLASSLETVARLRGAGFVLYTNMWLGHSSAPGVRLPPSARAMYRGDLMWTIMWRLPDDGDGFSLTVALEEFARQVGCVENHGVCQTDVWAVQERYARKFENDVLPLVARRLNGVAVERARSAGDVSGHDVADALMDASRWSLQRRGVIDSEAAITGEDFENELEVVIGGRPLGVNGAIHEVFLPFDSGLTESALADVTNLHIDLHEVVAHAAVDPAFRENFRRAYLETAVCRRLSLANSNCLAVAKSWGVSWG